MTTRYLKRQRRPADAVHWTGHLLVGVGVAVYGSAAGLAALVVILTLAK